MKNKNCVNPILTNNKKYFNQKIIIKKIMQMNESIVLLSTGVNLNVQFKDLIFCIKRKSVLENEFMKICLDAENMSNFYLFSQVWKSEADW